MHAVPDKLTILLADDDPNDSILIRRAFKRLPALGRLITVSTGSEALAYLQGEGAYGNRTLHPFPDVLFLDYRMPGLSGLAALCWLRSDVRFEHLPVVILSGSVSAAQSEMANRMAAACCPKSATSASMAEAMMESIRNAFRLANFPAESSPTVAHAAP